MNYVLYRQGEKDLSGEIENFQRWGGMSWVMLDEKVLTESGKEIKTQELLGKV